MKNLYSAKVNENERTYFLYPGQKLSKLKYDDVDFTAGLPNGILNKKYTGVGATYSELHSARPSIFIFPYKILAKEKSHDEDEPEKTEHCFYFRAVPKSVDHRLCNFKQLEKHLENYPVNPKICLVVDGMEKLVKALEELGFIMYEDFFLVLDEIEVLQMHSGFRPKIPLAFDYFKKFTNKCLVTATPLKLNDKKLKKLFVHNVQVFEDPSAEEPIDYKPIDLKVLGIKNPVGEVAHRVADIISKHGVKVLVGINSLDDIKEFIQIYTELCRQDGKLNANDISVITSEDSKYKFEAKYRKPINKKKLTAKLTLCTSVLFNGIDIKEQYFAVAISLDDELHHLFSLENLVQFYGRGREGLIGAAFVYKKDIDVSDFEIPTDQLSIEERTKSFQDIIDGISTSKLMLRDKNALHKAIALTNTRNPTGLLYENIEGKATINYMAQDLQEYINQVINDYRDVEKNLIPRLQDSFKVKIVKPKTMFEPTTEFEPSTGVPEILSYFESGMTIREVLNFMLNRKNNIKPRTACLWYLLGLSLTNKKINAIAIATKYGNISKYNEGIFRSVVEGLLMYKFHKPEFDSMTKKLISKRSNNNRIYPQDILDVFDDYSGYVPAIFKSNYPKTTASQFFRHFFGIEPSNAGVHTNYEIIGDELKPALIRKFKSIELSLNRCKFNDKLPIDSNMTTISQEQILFYDFTNWNG